MSAPDASLAQSYDRIEKNLPQPEDFCFPRNLKRLQHVLPENNTMAPQDVSEFLCKKLSRGSELIFQDKHRAQFDRCLSRQKSIPQVNDLFWCEFSQHQQ